MKLAIITCTINFDIFHTSTLYNQFPSIFNDFGKKLTPLIIVDQGKCTVSADASHIIRITQANFGGAGGFTRGILEAISLGATHFILIDDDATPDMNSISLVLEYYEKFPEKMVALHGAMFSLDNPEVIYEAGAWCAKPLSRKFHITRRLANHRVIHENIADDPVLWKNMDIDYGAWWFFACPIAAVRKVGLPMPLFIRGDDKEYGIRLKKNGIPTIPLPGLRIWHPVHADKPNNWYLYFSWRNNFIEKAIHYNGSTFLLAIEIFKKIFYRLLSFRYDEIGYIIFGLINYLQGPEILLLPIDYQLSFAKSIEKLYPIYFIENENSSKHNLVLMEAKQPPSIFKEIFFLILFNGIWHRKSLSPIFKNPRFHWTQVFGIEKYAVKFTWGIKIYERKFGVLLKLSLKSLFYLGIFMIKNWKLKLQWKIASQEFATESFWRDYLNIPTK